MNFKFYFILLMYGVSAEVKSPPYLVNQPPSGELFFLVTPPKAQTKPFEIECEAKGDPEPSYRWTKNGVNFDISSQGDRIRQLPGKGTLHVVTPHEDDAGRYQCYAENRWGISTSNSVSVRKTELGFFKDDGVATQEAHEGEPFQLACPPPYSYPKPNVNWGIQDQTGEFSQITNPQIAKDPNGNWWLLNISTSDESNDSYYYCSLTMPTTANMPNVNDVRIGHKTILKVHPKDPNTPLKVHAPIQQYVSQKQETAVLNKRARFYCVFIGTPVAEVTWYKDNKPLLPSSRITLNNQNTNVEIKKTALSDEGEYTCRVNNGIGDPILYNFTLAVLVQPQITDAPQNTTVDEDETVEFHCQGTGLPEPQIQWIHNGKPISEAAPNDRRTVTNNKIVIEKVLKTDTGNYGCNVSNTLGYVYAEAYVNVLAEPPTFIVVPQDKEVLENGEIIMPCEAVGSPKPHIIWFRNNTEIVDEEHLFIENGNLKIIFAEPANSAQYTCVARNKISTINTTVTLTIRKRTKIDPSFGLFNIRATAGKSTTLNCTVQKDAGLELNIAWYHDTHLIDTATNSRFIQDGNTLKILNLIDSDSGTYVCNASTRMDYDVANTTLIVQDTPNAPKITNIDCHGKEVEISWMNTGDNRSPITEYLIEYITTLTPDGWNATDPIPPTSLSLKLPVIRWANYTFKIFAKNEIGISMPSPPMKWTADPDIPHRNPENVTVRGTQPGTLEVSWTPMTRIEHNGPDFHYNVSWKKDTLEDEWITQHILDWETRQYTILNLTYDKYLIKVTAGNALGPSDAPYAEIVEYPPAEPPVFTIYPRDEEILENDNVVIRCEVTGSPKPRITWFKNDTQVIYDEHSQVDNGNLSINNITSADTAQYTCIAQNEASVINATANLTVRKRTRIDPSFGSSDIRAIAGNATTLKCAAEKDTGLELNITWYHNMQLVDTTANSRLISDGNTLTISNLIDSDSGTYTCKASTHLDHALANTTLIVQDIPNPPKITTINRRDGDVEISWTNMGDHWSPITNYFVEYTYYVDRTNTTPHEWITSDPIPSTSLSYKLPVVRWAIYIFKIFAKNEIGISKSSPLMEWTADPDIPHRNPENLTVLGTEPGTLEVSWTPMPIMEHNGPGFHYNVSWKKGASEGEWIIQHVPEEEIGKYIIRNLTYDKYQIKVAAGNDLGPSDAPCIAMEEYPPAQPPVFITSPRDEELLENDNVTITCEATGSPYPLITWFKGDIEVINDEHYHVENGNLNIINLTSADTAQYTCIAQNKASSINATANLIVRKRTRVRPSFGSSDVRAIAGHTTILECAAEKDAGHDLNTIWYHNANLIDPATNSRLVQNNILTILNLTDSDSGIYTCNASTPLDHDTANITLIVQNIPNPPSVTLCCEDQRAEISWMNMGDNRSPITNYVVHYNTSSPTEEWKSNNSIPPTASSYEIQTTPWITYTFTVFAQNEIGISAPSLPQTCESDPKPPYRNPENVTVQSTEQGTFEVSWIPIPKTEHYGPGFYYELSWKKDTPEGNWETQIINEWETSRWTIHNLLFDKYYVKVIAENDLGQSNASVNIIEAYPQEDEPLEGPQNLTLVEILSPTEANISWSRVSKESLRGHFRGYKIQTWPEYDQQKGNVVEILIQEDVTSFIIDKLIPNTKNKVHISVLNGLYSSPSSDDLEINTPEGVPEPVPTLEASPFGSSAINLHWEPPIITNGNLTGYKIYYQTITGTEFGPELQYPQQITDPNQTQLKLSGLNPDTKYRVIITATTNAGEGKRYTIEQQTPQSITPIKPNFQFVATKLQNSSEIQIFWRPCGSDKTISDCVDQPIGSEFYVKYKIKGEQSYNQVSEPQHDNVVIHDLQPNQEYEFVVGSMDGPNFTESDPQDISTYLPTTPPPIPETPFISEPVPMLEASTLGSSALNLHWQPPTTTNGTLTGYNIFYETINGTEFDPITQHTQQIIDPNQTRLKLHGLQPSTKYRITIKSTTDAGEGDGYSIEQQTLESVPPTKPNFQLIQPNVENSSEVHIFWRPCGPDKNVTDCTGESTGSSFYVKYKIKGELSYNQINETQTDTVVVRDLQPNQRYEFVVGSVDGTYTTESDPQEVSTNIPTPPPAQQLAPEATKPFKIETIATDTDVVQIPQEDRGYQVKGLLVIILSIIAVLFLIAIVICLTRRNRGKKYLVYKQEQKNRRPDCTEDSDCHESSQPLNGVVVDGKTSKNGINEIPLIPVDNLHES